MQDLGFLFKIGFKKDFVGFLFGLTEDDSSTMSATIKIDDVCNNGVSMVVGAI
jgi:hypothetical protein